MNLMKCQNSYESLEININEVIRERPQTLFLLKKKKQNYFRMSAAVVIVVL